MGVKGIVQLLLGGSQAVPIYVVTLPQSHSQEADRAVVATTSRFVPLRQNVRRPVSRVLSAPCGGGRPFLWDAPRGAPRATNPGDGAGMPLRPPAHGPWPGSDPGQAPWANAAGRPYSVLLPVGFALPPLLPGARCALAAPFHPCPQRRGDAGGLFSVALSLGSPPPAVSRHRIPVEPGLSSTARERAAAAVQPPDPPDVRPAGDGVNRAPQAPASIAPRAQPPQAASTAASRARVPSSASPAAPSGHQCRWNARSSTGSARSAR